MHGAGKWKQKLGRAALSIQKSYRGHRVRVQQEFLRAQAAAAAAAATRIQKTWRGRRARSQIQLIDPASLGHAKKAIDDVALFAQIPQLTKQRLLTKLRRKRYPVHAAFII